MPAACSPHHSVNTTVLLRTTLSQVCGTALGSQWLTVRHSGDCYTNNANSDQVAGHPLLDAQLIWQSSLGRFTLRGRNLTDKLYANWSGYGPTQLYLGAPRRVDFTFNRSF